MIQPVSEPVLETTRTELGAAVVDELFAIDGQKDRLALSCAQLAIPGTGERMLARKDRLDRTSSREF